MQVLYFRVAACAEKLLLIGASPALVRTIKNEVLLPWKGNPRRGVRREYPLSPEHYTFASTEMDREVKNCFAEEIKEGDTRRNGLVFSGFVGHGSKPRVAVYYSENNEVLQTKNFKMEPWQMSHPKAALALPTS
jgi:hypothetical protein